MYPYPDCKWCHGRGCIACKAEFEKAEAARQKPMFVADRSNPHDMELLKQYFGTEALEHAFGERGEGMAEIEQNAALASLLQLLHNKQETP